MHPDSLSITLSYSSRWGQHHDYRESVVEKISLPNVTTFNLPLQLVVPYLLVRLRWISFHLPMICFSNPPNADQDITNEVGSRIDPTQIEVKA